MDEKKTMLIVYVKAPTVLEPEKIEMIRHTIREKIVEPFKFEERVHYAEKDGILSFYIFRPGRLKNSVRDRLEKKKNVTIS